MNAINAYEIAMTKIKELEKSGIKVEIKTCKSSNNPEIVEEYNKQGHIPPELWRHVTFHPKDKYESLSIHEAANYLGMIGVCFDTGGGCGGRDWELDWSFEYSGEIDNDKQREARDEVENMLQDMGM
jgi:hypothetical protein